MSNSQQLARPQPPRGINHLVLGVRNIDESHAFWTEYLGFTHVGTTYDRGGNDRPPKPTRYYSGLRDGRLSHHDIALAEDPRMVSRDLEPVEVNHIAIEYASEEAWRHQIGFLSSRNIAVRGCVRRGTTLSARVVDPNGYLIEIVCDLPRERWEADIDAALNEPPLPLRIDTVLAVDAAC